MGLKGKVFMTVLGTILFAGSAWCARPADQSGSADRPRMQCQERFGALDANGDKTLTKQEFMAAPHPGGHAEEIFNTRDANGDGALTLEEFCSGGGFRGGRGRQ